MSRRKFMPGNPKIIIKNFQHAKKLDMSKGGASAAARRGYAMLNFINPEIIKNMKLKVFDIDYNTALESGFEEKDAIRAEKQGWISLNYHKLDCEPIAKLELSYDEIYKIAKHAIM
jgi:hypothetical protein